MPVRLKAGRNPREVVERIRKGEYTWPSCDIQSFRRPWGPVMKKGSHAELPYALWFS